MLGHEILFLPCYFLFKELSCLLLHALNANQMLFKCFFLSLLGLTFLKGFLFVCFICLISIWQLPQRIAQNLIIANSRSCPLSPDGVSSQWSCASARCCRGQPRWVLQQDTAGKRSTVSRREEQVSGQSPPQARMPLFWPWTSPWTRPCTAWVGVGSTWE